MTHLGKCQISETENRENDAEQFFSSASDEIIHTAIADQGILVIGLDDRIEFASKNLHDLVEVPKELLQKGVLRHEAMKFRIGRGDHGPIGSEERDKLVTVFRHGINATVETRTPSGRVICVHAIPLPSDGSIVTFTDLTHVHESAQEIDNRRRALDLSEQKNNTLVQSLKAVVDNIDYGVVFMDPDMKAVLINRAFRVMWDMDDDLCESRPHMREVMEFNRDNGVYDVEDADFDDYVSARVEAVRDGEISQTEMRRKDGKILSYQSVALANGYRMLTYFDITDIKHREAENRRQSEAMAIIQSAIGHGLSWIDKDLHLRAWNDKCIELLEFEDADIQIGDSLEKMFRFNALRGEYGDGDVEQQVHERMELSRQFQPHSFERTRRDGTILKIDGYPVSEGGFVTVYTDVTEARRSEEQIRYLAHHDVLTGLANRAQFIDCLELAYERVRAHGESIAVISFDLDHFKDVNDTMGHNVGDQLLQLIAGRVKELLNDDDIFARLGGDEFIIIRQRVQNAKDAGALAQKIVDAASTPFLIDGHEIAIGASAGISIMTPERHMSDPNQLLRESDIALYSVKSERRGTYCYFQDQMNVKLHERKNLERDLRKAVEDKQFEVFYQPQVDAKTHEIVGVEALVRWNHPDRGLIGPVEFIEVAEVSGLIRQIGQFVLETACAEIGQYDSLKLAVNLSPVQFRMNDIKNVVSGALAATGFDPTRLELEITENVLLLESRETNDALYHFKTLGISIVLDDFGTGYSSLSYLRKYPFDKLKIDRNFIADMGHDADSNAIVQAVISLGKSLGMRLNAEGVETHLQADVLCLEGCDELQGYFFGKPMMFSYLEKLVAGQSGSKNRNASEKQPAEGENSRRNIARIA
ncbi:MAG: EAL domain-containing protein [Fimbriimonadaceae bacterium]|nr:EAL domain-containing protein [Alphaproteobacteria bacterium]